jgi:hypothetical protein
MSKSVNRGDDTFWERAARLAEGLSLALSAEDSRDDTDETRVTDDQWDAIVARALADTFPGRALLGALALKK